MDVHHLDCLEKYEKLIRFIRPFLWGVGVDVFDPNYRLINWRSIVAFIFETGFWICLIYTLFIYRDNFIEFVKTASASGPIVLITAKLTTLAMNYREIYNIHQTIIKLHMNSRDVFTKILDVWTSRLSLTANICLVLYLGTGVFFVLGPIAIYYLYGEKMLVIPVEPPFIDVKNWTGFLVTSAYEVLCSVYAVAVLGSVDAMFIAFCFTAVGYMEMVGMKCEKLTEKIEMLEDKSAKIAEKDITNALKDIIIAGLELDRFTLVCP